MRNLTLTATTTTAFHNANISATTIDLDEGVIYAASERQSPDGEVEVEIWKMPQTETGEKGPPSIFTTFTAIASSHGSSYSQIVSFRVIPESRRLAVIMRGGDITVISIDEEDPVTEVEGTVEPGILVVSWSPDDSLLALATGEGRLILMTSNFDVLSEAPLDTADFGEDAPINVGWGSKQTQFHGSLGKAAAQAPAAKAVGSSPDDDSLPRLSWRGDGAFFVVSSLSPPAGDGFRRRILRVYDRQAALQSTSEPVAGLEHSLVWRPSGNVIVGTQRFGFEGGGAGVEGRHDVVFFERNGLRHGEFGLRVNELTSKKVAERSEERKWGYKVRELSWNSDSSVLGVWIERDEGDIVQLWTTGNYHWYLKQEISAPSNSAGHLSRFTSVEWHPEIALQLILTTSSEVISRTYGWETFSSPPRPPIDSGAVAVFDGYNILLTPFRTQNVPPPMYSHQLALSPSALSSTRPRSIPIHASFSPEDDALAVLWETGHVEIWSLQTRLGPGRGKVVDPVQTWSGFIDESHPLQYRQIAARRSGSPGKSSAVVVLGSTRAGDVIAIIHLEEGKVLRNDTIQLSRQNCRLVEADRVIVCQAPDGELLQYDEGQSQMLPVARFPEFCLQSQCVVLLPTETNIPLSATILYVGLGKSGKLYVTNNTAKEARILASNSTSFTVASGFVIYTTSAHEAIFAPLRGLPPLLDDFGDGPRSTPTDWETRRVERGSRIVVAIPSSMSLVLQMPRGNLETINPRPLVMEVVKQDLDAGNYRKAFFACRKHRIDLNVLVDHNQAAFLQRVSSFVEQVHEVDHINLFLTGLGRGSQPPETITKLCDTVREELQKADLTKYVNSILTAYVVKTPADHEAGLALLLRLRGSDPHLVEDAVKYIIFLVDADRLFDTALGMYDFELVLMIAQHAQKDPREYLPFLRELRALPKYYQRFRIDDHLRRHESALRNLSLAGSDYFEEALVYVERHRLYEAALLIWVGTPRYDTVLELYGDWLFERREFRQAASVFVEGKKLSKAMVAHEKAMEWRELFDLALRTEMVRDDIVQMSYRVAEDLSSKKRHSEAARVLLDYAGDIREGIIALVTGNNFSEARRVATLNSKPELLEDVIQPAALESRSQMSDDILEMREQIRKQLDRIRELRVKKIEEPDAFYGTEDPNLHNVDVMTDVSMPATAYTRYTVAPTTASRSSKRSSRSKRKMERKAGSGRKGTIDEEEYLLKSITKLVGRFSATQDEVRNLLPHLFQFTPEHRDEGLDLQKELGGLEEEMKQALEEIWLKPSTKDEGESVEADTWASRMEEREKARQIDPSEKVPKPELPRAGGWRMSLLDIS